MQAYRLDPIDPKDPRWLASSIKERVWTMAHSDGEARNMVAAKTAIAAKPTERYAVIRRSPWLDDKLALCVLDTSRKDVPEGAVITANGRPIPAH
jgi:hypothetical protein